MRDALQRVHWVKFRNDSGETVPAFGVLRITGFTPDAEEGFFTVSKPNTFGSQYMHAINADLDVPSASDAPDANYGYCCLGQMIGALYDDADGVPAFGELWGPRSGTWMLKKNTGGFRVVTNNVLSDLDNTILVVQEPFTWFAGVADEAISAGAPGDVDIQYWDGDEFQSTGVIMSEVLNRLDVDIEESAAVECKWNDDVAGSSWRIVQSHYDCT